MVDFLLVALFATETVGYDPTPPHPFNCWDQNGKVLDDYNLSLITGSISALAYDLRKGVGLIESKSYIAKYFHTNTTEGKKEFWVALRIFNAKIPDNEHLISAHNFLVQELTRYYKSAS